jgi:hypothetical protein
MAEFELRYSRARTVKSPTARVTIRPNGRSTITVNWADLVIRMDEDEAIRLYMELESSLEGVK